METDSNEKENRGAVPITVSVPYDMYKWLEEHKKEINRSKLFQETIYKLMKPKKKMNSSLLLLTVLTFSFGVALIILANAVAMFSNMYSAVTTFLLGVLLIFTSLIVFLREVKPHAKR